jgi:hypothetical protein
MTGKATLFILSGLLLLQGSMQARQSPSSFIQHDAAKKTLTLTDSSKNLVLQLNYAGGASIGQVLVLGKEVLGKGNTAFSGISRSGQAFSSETSLTAPVAEIKGNEVHLRDIKFGDASFSVAEEWVFTVQKDNIDWEIRRQYLNDGIIDRNCFPCWQFNSIRTWDGTLLDNGGVAWNRFLSEPGETYGAHTAALSFWNRQDDNCLKVTPAGDPNVSRVTAFSHEKNGVFAVTQISSEKDISMRHGLRRFLQTGQDVFGPDTVRRSSISIQNKLAAAVYSQEYNRGTLKGIKSSSVNEMLNTIGRYGVVDKNLYGSNGWRTGWAVLQEPWLALFGLAINDSSYINGYSATLEYERDQAMLPDGRVLPRWHHDAGDAMPNTFLPNGFYECQWGYMFDSQPAFAIDVAEQFDLNGDTAWLRRFKGACEKALDFMIKRDTDGNGLFEVAQSTYKEGKGADWMDVVWASYEVASINAYMYKALVRWAALEKLLGDETTAAQYSNLAAKLKAAFNKSTANGGFWNADKQWYAYWREKDGSVYGNNFVSMVNFLAIGYGLCDDESRKAAILGNMETLMQRERLFIWPSCFYPYDEGLGHPKVNYPYPSYENGDLFLAWAELGTRCYAEKHPETALKYIRNVIDQYDKDGLAHQRYTRVKQTGAGDDILSNNIMAVVGLYRNIYGVRPQYNRLYLEPHLSAELNGTQFKYWLRGTEYVIDLAKDNYRISAGHYSIANNGPFAVNYGGGGLEYFKGDAEEWSLKVTADEDCAIEMLDGQQAGMRWKTGGGRKPVRYECRLRAGAAYQLLIDHKPVKDYTTDESGMLSFELPPQAKGAIIQLIPRRR